MLASRSTYASLNRTTTFCVGISAAFATSLFVMALIMAAATCFRTSGLALQAYKTRMMGENWEYKASSYTNQHQYRRYDNFWKGTHLWKPCDVNKRHFNCWSAKDLICAVLYYGVDGCMTTTMWWASGKRGGRRERWMVQWWLKP